ncbi:MAG: hypothetical protein NUV61_02140 [Candidatus Azambacteria bacterium]|nr:hypothetical protein [Candidatus Azambacteria bacterium]
MNFKVLQVEKYGVQVLQHPEMDDLRRTQCLCLNCAEMQDCAIAAAGFELCKKYNIAYAVTRCPYFDMKQEQI